jgi:uncharacterized LabA/DUF88 family protein
MNKKEIKSFLESFSDKLDRTIVIVDFGNVEKWKESMGWKVGIQELANLAKNFSKGDMQLRRFYYGSDFGPNMKSVTLTPWSKSLLDKARWNRFEVVEKRVKYIHDNRDPSGFVKKCDLDVEMAVDLIKTRDLYDHIVVFSGDGDIAYALRYLKESFGKLSYVFSARGHIGGEIVQGVTDGFIQKMLFAEDFEYRLNMERFKYA